MADNTTTAHSDNKVMDYPEHERTYSMFLTGTKWLTILCVALLIGMAFGFYAGFGFVGGTIVFILVSIIAGILI